MPDKELTEAREAICEYLTVNCLGCEYGGSEVDCPDEGYCTPQKQIADKILNLRGSNWHIEVVVDGK